MQWLPFINQLELSLFIEVEARKLTSLPRVSLSVSIKIKSYASHSIISEKFSLHMFCLYISAN